MSAERSLMYEFVSEAKEHLANIGDDLLALEQRKDDSARYRIDRLFRSVHSVKGGAGFFGRRAIEELAHAMETVLDHLRSENACPPPAVIDALLAGADRIQALLDDVEHSNDADVSGPLARLQAFVPAGGRGPIAPRSAADSRGASPAFALTEAPLAERPAGHAFLYGVRVDLAECRRRRGLAPLAVIQRVQAAGALLNARLDVADADLDAGLPAGPVWYRAVVSRTLAPEPFRRALGLPEAEVVLLEPATEPALRTGAAPPTALAQWSLRRERAGRGGAAAARRRRRQHPHPGRPGRSAHDAGRGAGAGAQPGAALASRRRRRPPAHRPAPRRRHRRAAGSRPANADAAGRQSLRPLPPHGPRPGQAARQADRAGPVRRRGGAGQDHPGVDVRSADAPGPQLLRPRHRVAGGARAGRQACRGPRSR